MNQPIIVSLAAVLALGIGAQLLAWRLRVPAILMLLIMGFLAGPVTGFLNPDELLGDLLLPIVSLSVGIILFDGGLSLRFSEIRAVGGVVTYLVTVGALVTWVVCTLAAYAFLGLDWSLAILFGAILVVTGPTVIIPLLRQVRPRRPLGSILKWEGIVIDPVGVTLTVLVYEAVFLTQVHDTVHLAAMGLLRTIVVGIGLGSIGAVLIVVLFRKYWAPDYLQNPVTLAVVVVAYAVSNLLQQESGLLTVTFMGVILANQRMVSVRHVAEFKENLQVLLIAMLFILLGARLNMGDLAYADWRALGFLLVLIFVARPLCVLVSTIRSTLSWQDRVFLSSVAPRGIVAASVASVFALRLTDVGHSDAYMLVPYTFLVIIGTVTVYGLGAAPMARFLNVSQSDPQGVLFIGCHPWVREIARVLYGEGFMVHLVDTNLSNVTAARVEGLPATCANVLSEREMAGVDLNGLGKMVAMTSNDEVNSLAALYFAEQFGRAEVYQIWPHARNRSLRESMPRHLQGRCLFSKQATFSELSRLFEEGAQVKSTRVSNAFTYEDYRKLYGERAIPLFFVTDKRVLIPCTVEDPVRPRQGYTIISLVTSSSLEE